MLQRTGDEDAQQIYLSPMTQNITTQQIALCSSGMPSFSTKITGSFSRKESEWVGGFVAKNPSRVKKKW